MKLLLLLTFILLQLPLLAIQISGSPQAIQPPIEEEAQAKALLDSAYAVYSTDSASSLSYLQSVRDYALKNHNTFLAARAFYLEGETFYVHGDYRDAIDRYEEAVALYLKADSVKYTGELYNSIGMSYYYVDEFEKALANLIEAVKTFEINNDPKGLSRMYINMAMVYNRLGDYVTTIEYYKRAASLSENIGATERVGAAFNGVGVGYYNDSKMDSAKIYFRKAMRIFRSIDNEFRMAATINNLANIYLDEGDSLELGLKYYQEAYEVFDRMDDLRRKVFVMEGLGCAYRDLGNYSKAMKIFNEGLRLSVENDYGYYILHLFYKDISMVYELQGKTEQAFSFYKQFKAYQDSMRREERLWQATAIEKKYEMSKSEALISQLNAEKELTMVQLQKDRAFRNLGIFAILFLLIVITYVSFGNYNRKKINRILTEKNIQIEAQRNELEQLNASKNKFFSLIAHDLKNPLHTVLGFSYLLNHEYERFDDVSKKKYAKDIYNATNNIFRLLQNLLDWSRSQTGRLKYEPVIFELSSMQEKICNLLKPYAEQKNIDLKYDVPGDIYVYATPMMIETILRNLVSNAIKFTKSGGEVSISFKHYEKEVSICVKDTGIGMTEEEVDQLFSIESKIRKKGTENEEGSGLGLILCYEFIKLNRGKIWAESKEGEGSCFCFTVPWAMDNV